MQESRRDIAGKLAFDTLLDDIRLALRPRHDYDLFSLSNSVDSHGDCAFRDVFYSTKAVGSIFSSDSMEIHQAGDTVDRRRRLIEPDMSSPSNTQYLDIDSSISFDLFLIISTKLDHILSLDFSIRNVNIFFGYVDVIEEVIVHVVVVGLGVIILDGIVFI